jgi:hypothetical protein
MNHDSNGGSREKSETEINSDRTEWKPIIVTIFLFKETINITAIVDTYQVTSLALSKRDCRWMDEECVQLL